jgi:hypothetical protein
MSSLSPPPHPEYVKHSKIFLPASGIEVRMRILLSEEGYMKSFLAGLIMMLLASVSHAQINVSLATTGEDIIGKRLAFEIREGVRRSAAMRLVDSEERAAIRLQLVTLNPSEQSGSQNWTVYSVVYTVANLSNVKSSLFMNHYVGTCGSSKISACAAGIVAETDEWATAFKANISK